MSTTLTANYTNTSVTTSTVEIVYDVEKSPLGGIRIVAKANANDDAPSHVESAKINYVPVGNTVDLTVGGNSYSYTVEEGDTAEGVALKLASLINAGDEGLSAAVNPSDLTQIVFTSDQPGAGGTFTIGTATTNSEVTIANNVVTGAGVPDMRVVGYMDVGARMAGEFLQFFHRSQFAEGTSTPAYIGNISPETGFAQANKKLGAQLSES